MGSIGHDLRFAFRNLRKSPGFALISILMLALTIGAVTIVFSVVEGVLMRPLSFHDASRLVLLKEKINKLGGVYDVPAPDVLTFERDSRAFTHVGGFTDSTSEISGTGEPIRVPSERMTASVFPTLGVDPLLGRWFSRQEDEQGQQVAVLSYLLWKNHFHADPQILGRTIDINRKPYVVVGVMPRQFEFPLVPGRMSQVQLWVPMSFTPKEKADEADNFQYGVIARMKPGISSAQAAQDANRVVAAIVAGYPAGTDLRATAKVLPLKAETVNQARPLLRVLFGAVIVVQLIACANLAGLLLVRANRRRREYAVRLAVGASGAALLRQSLLEALLLSVSGGVLGVLLAAGTLRIWITLLPNTLPRIQSIGLNWAVVGFALATAVITGVLCAIAPAAAAMRTNVNSVLKDGGRDGATSASHARVRSALVVGEVATALMLLTAAGLLLRSFERMRSVDPGFRPEHVVAASLTLPSAQYTAQTQVDEFHASLLRTLQSLPGVESTGLVSTLPMAEPGSIRVFTPSGYQPPPGAGYASEAQTYVASDYFQTMGIPLLRGRYLNDSDTVTSPLVIVVNRTLAERYWPGVDPVGKRIMWGTRENNELPWLTVVGEVADTKQGALDSKTMAQVYEPLSQRAYSFGPKNVKEFGVVGRSMRVVVRTATDPRLMEGSITRAIWSLDPQLAVTHVQTMDQAISTSEAPRRFNTTVIVAFAFGAVFLAILGIYGVIAFTVVQRTQELAIRMALGAQRGGVMKLVLSSGLKLAAIGCAVGFAASLTASRLLQSLLFDVSPFDPAVFILATAAVLLLALAASFVPARRAASIEPMQALRME